MPFSSTMHPKEFLHQFSEQTLLDQGILNTGRNILNGDSVRPLVRLMQQNRVAKLQAGSWFLDTALNFSNPSAKESGYRHGSHNLTEESIRLGVAFEGQNPLINPYYVAADLSNGAVTRAIATSVYDTSIFINEVVSSPENRINLNIFGLLNVESFCTWFLRQLGLDPDRHTMFPSKTTSSGSFDIGRPDFEIRDDQNQFVAYVEIELGGENPEQLQRYRRMAPTGKVFSVTGRSGQGADLSLEEILQRLIAFRNSVGRQTAKYIAAYEAMYVEFVLLAGQAASYPVAEVSPQMREHVLVQALTERLPVSFDISSDMRPGEFRMNTRKEEGFSLRIYSARSTTQHSLSIMAISGGRPQIIFPSHAKLTKYLPSVKHSAVADFTALLASWGYHISNLEEKQQIRVPLDIVLEHINALTNIIKHLGTS